MPKELMDVATSNARYFSAKIGGTGGKRYQYLLGKLNDYHQAKGGTSPATHETMTDHVRVDEMAHEQPPRLNDV